MGGDTSGAVKRCGCFEYVVFIIAIVCGTACSICSKTMMELHGVGITGEVELFQKPIFQTFGMFIGMISGIAMHWIVLIFKIPFPGYDFDTNTTKPPNNNNANSNNNKNGANTESSGMMGITETSTLLPPKNAPKLQVIQSQQPLLDDVDPSSSKSNNHTPVWMYFFLAIPSVFDLAATAFCMMGLVYLDVSIYQLLRGSGIIFVALMKQHAFGDHLFKFQWIGVFWNVISVLLVGSTAMLNSGGEDTKHTVWETFLGIVLVLAGAFVQALQFVFEEKVMHVEDAAVSPLLLIGMEGVWGTILCLAIAYPLAYYLPGDDHGSYEDPFNTWHMMIHTPTLQWAFLVYFFVIFGYNLFAVLLTFLLNSVWHAILDNFRPITIWGTDMFIYYVVTAGVFGEPWTKYSWIQVVGMFVLLYGTAVYNAPNAGSVELRGKWYSFYIDMSREYDQINLEERELDQETTKPPPHEERDWEAQFEAFKQKRHSSLAERSPHISVHTQALRSLGSPHI